MASVAVLLVGAGPMAIEYAKVLTTLGIKLTVVGLSQASAQKFKDATGVDVSIGGIDAWLENRANVIPSHTVVAVGEKWIGGVAQSLLNRGAQSILLEKPGGYDVSDIRDVNKKAQEKNADVFVAYNRRYYASVMAAKKIVLEDGGIRSFSFEFTEWSHVIGSLQKEAGVKEQWFLSNSSHVIDLAFHLGGIPVSMHNYTAGSLEWHPQASIFAGAGITNKGALFSYQANWAAPGRWGLELLTNKHRLIFRPIEELQIQKIGSVVAEKLSLNDQFDRNYKPGLYNLVRIFIENQSDLLVSIAEQVDMLEIYLRIRGDTR